MVNHVNVYENITEAHQRLLHTIVMYDKEPYRVVAITEHKADKVFRIYLLPIPYGTEGDYPARVEGYRHGSAEQGEYLDEFIKAAGTNCKLIRKKMNSPLFNRFRPFPLGMLNVKGETRFLQRQPQRVREQGLIRSTVLETSISLDSNTYESTCQRELNSKEFRDCVIGTYPSFAECMKEFADPETTNKSVAFDRNFAIIKGPLDLLFLVYKTDCIGLINQDQSVLLSKDFKHCRELVGELGVFTRVNIKQ